MSLSSARAWSPRTWFSAEAGSVPKRAPAVPSPLESLAVRCRRHHTRALALSILRGAFGKCPRDKFANLTGLATCPLVNDAPTQCRKGSQSLDVGRGEARRELDVKVMTARHLHLAWSCAACSDVFSRVYCFKVGQWSSFYRRMTPRIQLLRCAYRSETASRVCVTRQCVLNAVCLPEA